MQPLQTLMALIVMLASPAQVAGAPVINSGEVAQASMSAASESALTAAEGYVQPAWWRPYFPPMLPTGIWALTPSKHNAQHTTCQSNASVPTTATVTVTTAAAALIQHSRKIYSHHFQDYGLPLKDYRWTVPSDQPTEIIRRPFMTSGGSKVNECPGSATVTITETAPAPTDFIAELLLTIA